MEGGGTYGRKMKKYISICLKVLKIYIITGLIFFLACFGLDRVGLRMQKGFFLILLEIILIGLSASTWRMGLRFNREKKLLFWVYLMLVPPVILGTCVYALLPYEREIADGMLCQKNAFSEECRYYDVKYFCFEEEFQWDESHDIRLLEWRYDKKFKYDEASGGKRKYIPAGNENKRVWIISYPTTNKPIRTNVDEDGVQWWSID